MSLEWSHRGSKYSVLEDHAGAQVKVLGGVYRSDEGWTADSFARTRISKPRKYLAQQVVEWAAMERILAMRLPSNLSTLQWGADSVGRTEYRVLRDPGNTTLHAYASIWYENTQFMAAIAGRGRVDVSQCTSWEEAQAVVLAVIRMGG